jgi:type VI secretion system secreted protein Hcp
MAAYIKFDGVDGECQDDKHKKWIDLESCSQICSRPGGGATGAARARGDVVLEDLVCSKLLDKSSPKLAEAVCKGKVFPKIQIDFTTSMADEGRSTYLSYELKNVLVTSYSLNAVGQSEQKPMESFSLNFEEIKMTYNEIGPDGKKVGAVDYSWKVQEGAK